MAKISGTIGKAWDVYAVMNDHGELVGLYAKDPSRPRAVEITQALRDLLKREETT